MSDITLLKNKIQELEDRIKILEGDKLWNDAILDKARELVLRYNKTSAIFLQKKLLIDYQRATSLVNKLRSEGIINSK